MKTSISEGSQDKRAKHLDILPSVLIIVVNWNGKDYVLECLESLIRQNYPQEKYKIFIIDNASNDGSQTAIRERYSNIILLENSKNLGYVKAVNQGIEHGLQSNVSYMWILNNDVVVHKEALIRLIEIGEEEENSGVLAPIVYSRTDPERIENCGYKINHWTGQLKKLRPHVDIFQSHNSRIRDVDSNMGCANLIKADVFREIGLFNPIYNVYFEETDFNVRAGKNGYRVILVREAKVWHRTAATMNQFLLRRAYLLLRNLLIFEFLNAKLYQLLFFIPYYFLIHIPYFLIYGYFHTRKIKKIQ